MFYENSVLSIRKDHRQRCENMLLRGLNVYLQKQIQMIKEMSIVGINKFKDLNLSYYLKFVLIPK